MMEQRKTYRVVVGKPEIEKISWRTRRMWKDNIKINLERK
jgi:hypothetical protein